MVLVVVVVVAGHDLRVLRRAVTGSGLWGLMTRDRRGSVGIERLELAKVWGFAFGFGLWLYGTIL